MKRKSGLKYMYGNVMTYGDSDMPIAQPVGCRLCSRNDDDDDDDDNEAEGKRCDVGRILP